MAFGFDPSIILSTRPSDPSEGVRTFSQLATMAQQRQEGQARLADLLRRQQREQGLADIYSRNSGNPDAVPGALLQEGYGNEGLAWLAKQAEIAAKNRAGLAKPVSPEEAERISARAEYERAKAKALGRPKAEDPLKREALQLRNEKLKRDLAKASGTGGPNKLLTLDGYDLDPSFDVKPEVAEKLRSSQAQMRQMIQSADELMGLYSKYGNKVLPGPARARMEAVARNLQLAAKGDAGYQLGVIAGPDMDLLNSVVPVPTGRQATVADFFTKGGDVSETMERLRVFREQMKGRFDNAASSRGYRRKAKAAEAKQAASGLTPEEQAELDALAAEGF